MEEESSEISSEESGEEGEFDTVYDSHLREEENIINKLDIETPDVEHFEAFSDSHHVREGLKLEIRS